MRKFQLQNKPPRIKKYIPWWKRDGYVDVFSIDKAEGRTVISANFLDHFVVINLPENYTFDQDTLLRYINTGHFLDIQGSGIQF